LSKGLALAGARHYGNSALDASRSTESRLAFVFLRYLKPIAWRHGDSTNGVYMLKNIP